MSFAGSTLIRTRDIQEVADIDRLSEDRSGSTISERQIAKFLDFISMYALAKNCYYDISVPKYYLEKTEESVDYLGLSDRVIAESFFEPESYFENLALSFQAAADLIKDGLDKALAYSASIKKPFVEKFCKTLNGMALCSSSKDRNELADEALSRDIMGGKFLKGLSMYENENFLLEFNKYMQDQSLEIQSARMSHSINTFRFFLHTRQAAASDSIYWANAKDVEIGDRYKTSVWRLIEHSLYNRLKAKDLKSFGQAAEVEELENVLPLIGVAVLLEAKRGDRPTDLFARADEMAKRVHLKRLSARIIEYQLSYEGGTKPDEIAAELWENIREKGGHKMIHPSKKILREAFHQILPETVIAGGVTLDTILQDASIEELWERIDLLAATSLARFLWSIIDLTRKHLQEGNYIAIVSHLLSVAGDTSKREICEKVKMVWGRELVP